MSDDQIDWAFTIDDDTLDNGFAAFQVIKEKDHDTNNISIMVKATTGSNTFRTRIKQKLLSRTAVVDHMQKSIDDWSKVVRFVFLGETTTGYIENRLATGFFRNLRLECVYNEEDEDLSIVIQHVYGKDRDEEIVTKLGEFRLNDYKLANVDITRLFRFTTNRLNMQLLECNQLVSEVDTLKKQLDEFITKKQEGDKDLIERFMVLLNTKKDKINELRGEAMPIQAPNKREYDEMEIEPEIKQESEDLALKDEPLEEPEEEEQITEDEATEEEEDEEEAHTPP